MWLSGTLFLSENRYSEICYISGQTFRTVRKTRNKGHFVQGHTFASSGIRHA